MTRMKPQLEPKPETYVTIRKLGAKNKAATYESWRYWEIFNEIQYYGVNRSDAHAASLMITGSEPGAEVQIGDLLLLEVHT